MITDNDISLAVASKSIIIGFNIRPNSVITKQAAEKGIEIRLYNIIYKVVEEMEDAMRGKLAPEYGILPKTGFLDDFKTLHISIINSFRGLAFPDPIIYPLFFLHKLFSRLFLS